MIRRLLFKNPSALFGILGALLAIVIKAVPAAAGWEGPIRTLLDNLALILVPTTALAIGAVAYAPVTVAKAVTEGALRTAESLTSEAAGVVGELTGTAASVALSATTQVLGATTDVAETAVGTLKRVAGIALP